MFYPPERGRLLQMKAGQEELKLMGRNKAIFFRWCKGWTLGMRRRRLGWEGDGG